MESEKFTPDNVHDLGSPEKVRAELQEEIARLERELEDPALSAPDIRAKEEELDFFRKQYIENNPHK